MKQKIKVLFDKNNIRNTLLNTAFILFLIFLAVRLIEQLFKTYGFESFVMSEFMINYQAGFVRRGLVGEILFYFVKNFNFDFEWTVKIVSLFWLALACVLFVKAFLKRGYTLYILPVYFFLGAGIVYDCWIRKDYLFICALIGMLSILNTDNKTPKIAKCILVNAIAIVTILSHESFVFLSLPIIFLLLAQDFKHKGLLVSFVYAAFYLLPSFISFLMVMIFKGDLQMAQAIWDAWLPVADNIHPVKLKPNDIDIISLSAIGWDTSWALSFHFLRNFAYIQNGMLSSFFWLMLYTIVYYIVSNALMVFRKKEDDFKARDKSILSAVLIFQFICLIPLFTVLSCDMGRIIFYWVASSFAIFIWIPASKLAAIIPTFIIKIANGIDGFLCKMIPPSKSVVLLLMMFTGTRYYAFSSEDIFNNSMIGQIIFILSKPMVLLKSYLLSSL